MTTDHPGLATSGSVTAELTSTRPASTVITISGVLDDAAGAEVARIIERALMATASEVTLDLTDLRRFTAGGIVELSQAVGAGCRLPDGVRLVLGGGCGRDAMVALCRSRRAAGPRRPGGDPRRRG